MERSNVYAEYATLNALPEIWPILAKRCGSFVALQDAYSTPAVILTFAQMSQQIGQFAAALQSLGVQEGDSYAPRVRISLFADNSARWFVADQGCMTAGAVDVVRSALADPQELAYIYQNSESSALLIEDLKTYQKLLPLLSTANLKFVGLLSDEPTPTDSLIPIVNFPRMLEMGNSHTFTAPQFKLDQLATLLYTSGTTGKPKGVRLTNANLMHQMNTFSAVLRPVPGDRAISILPTWHSFGRTVKYYLLSQGCTQVYTNIRNLKRDLLAYPPEFMASVPRLWESLYETIQKQFRDQPESKQKLVRFFFGQSQRYIEARRLMQGLDLTNLNPSLLQKIGAQFLCWVLAPVHGLGDRLVYTKVRDALGGKFKASVSGGGSLAMHLENFFEIVGINLLVGYGLTETSPVLTVRRLERNLRRSSGQPLKFTELQIVNLDTRQPLPLGQQGLVLARGPQIMEGYYNNPEATSKAIDPDGWFDTGDLGWLTSHSELVLTGRAKDTIVLSNGENIEPQPIEDACTRSPYIDQMMLVGQDQRSIGALIVPNIDALKLWAAGQNAVLVGHEDTTAAEGKAVLTFDSKPIQDLYRQELVREVQNRPGYRVDDRIGPVQFVLEPFSIDNGLLTQTLKVRRPVVMERYRDMIDGMFAS